MKMGCRRSVAALVFVSLGLPSVAGSDEQTDMSAATRDYEIVPCLLPARIRKLGNMTYPERRRLQEISARDCRLKGGEYTFYDRAKPEGAVAFFSKLAETGDQEAQVSLGDVYQYLFAEPNYEQAFYWYQQAADAGDKKGMMQLARLYERGLGVAADPLKATNLWREATGAGEELVLASTLEKAQTRATARINELSEQLRESNEVAESMRAELAVARAEIDSRRGRLATAQAQLAALQEQVQQAAAAQVDAQETENLRLQIAEQESVIREQRDQIFSLEDYLEVQQAQLTASLRQVERRNQRLTEELETMTASADDALQNALASLQEKDQQLEALRQNLALARNTLSDKDSAYAATLGQLEDARAEAGDSRRAQKRVADLEAQTSEQLSQLQTQQAEIKRLETLVSSTTSEADSLRLQLDSQIDSQAEAEARYASTEAELQRVRATMNDLQTQLAETNSALTEATSERDALERQLSAAAGDEMLVMQLKSELSRQNDSIRNQEQQITRLAEQVEGYQAELTDIRLQRSALAMRTPMLDTSSIRLPRDVKLGKFYALVIGNNDYEHLTDLENAENDARAIHELLQNDYGFESTLLVNGTEAQMFRAFSSLGGKLEENDMVLIYYAGHGFRSQNESYWLPVELASRQDAEVDGISSLKVADWVRSMAARHVMIVADSCYSGSGIETSGGFRYDIATLEASLPFFLNNKSRTMLSSGDVAPVMDGGGSGEHSVFTEALLGLLSENKGILHAGALHDYLVERVKYASDGTRVNQTPQFGSIESAGHETGQFVFLHRNVRGV